MHRLSTFFTHYYCCWGPCPRVYTGIFYHAWIRGRQNGCSVRW